MKKIFFIGLFCLIGCSIEYIDTKKCSYCEGSIYFHKTYNGIFKSKWEMNYKSSNNNFYHNQCEKIKYLEDRLNKEK